MHTKKVSKISLMSAILMTGLISGLVSSKAMAYFTVGESGDLPKEGEYRLSAEPQIVFTNSGFNFSGGVAALVRPDASVRVEMGFGDTSFETGVSYKWIPIPDYGNQPAVGGKIEANYATHNGSYEALRLIPLVSKHFETIYGLVTPYGAVPVDLVSTPSTTQVQLQLAGGCEYHAPEYPKWQFGAELGLNLNNAFSYIAGNVTYFLDDNDVSSKKRH